MASSRASAERSPISRSSKLLRAAVCLPSAQAELAVAAWELAGVRHSSIEYVLDEPHEEPWPGYDHRSDRAEVAAYLNPEQWAATEAVLRAALADLVEPEPEIALRRMPERDWRAAWHDHFDLVRIPGARPIVVRPPHIAHDAKPGEVVVDLVPGLAFGTGQHQSTRLCLRLLGQQIAGGERVLDVGTGSGILAVAAARLGAATVVATDIDPLAVDAARQTARQNQAADRIEVREASIPGAEAFDLITANLTADILQYLAADLATALQPRGRLIVSGLIETRLDEVGETLAGVGLELLAVEREDEWRAMLLESADR